MLLYSVRFSNDRFNFYNTESREELFFFRGNLIFSLTRVCFWHFTGSRKTRNFFGAQSFAKKAWQEQILLKQRKNNDGNCGRKKKIWSQIVSKLGSTSLIEVAAWGCRRRGRGVGLVGGTKCRHWREQRHSNLELLTSTIGSASRASNFWLSELKLSKNRTNSKSPVGTLYKYRASPHAAHLSC